MNMEIFAPKDFFPELQSEKERSLLPYVPTIAELLDFCSERYGERRAIIDGERIITYKELPAAVAEKRGVIRKKGVPEKANIGILCSGRTEAELWFLAAATSGRAAVMLPPKPSREQLQAMKAKFDLEAVISDAEDSSADGAYIFAGETAEAAAPCSELKGETPAAIFFTGGSTGAPKGAVLSHGALTRGALCGTTFRSGFVFENTTVAMLPMYHVFGAVAGFLSCLYGGTESYIFPDVPTAIGNIPAVKPTMLVLVPGLADLLLTMARLRGAGFLSGLKSIICGGAPVPAKLILGLYEYGVRIYPGYGLTEAANFSSANLNAVERPDSVGRLYPPQKMRIVEGELWLKGDNIMLGYYGDEEETARTFEDGWLKTGDLVSMDAEGYITITGRKKNVIILPNGENVYPERLEGLVNASELIKDCLVKEQTVNGTQLLAIEVFPDAAHLRGKTAEEITAAVSELIEKINSSLPEAQRLRSITIREKDFPRMPSMKIDRLHS